MGVVVMTVSTTTFSSITTSPSSVDMERKGRGSLGSAAKEEHSG